MLPVGAAGQEPLVSWHRSEAAPTPPAPIFHATAVVDLPTAVTLDKGLWQFEISHRFIPPFSDGGDALYGLDGPVNMRIALGYAASDHLSVTLGRSNLYDNVDLQFKYGRIDVAEGTLPLQAAVQLGGAWSTDYPGLDAGDSHSFQFYAQVVANARIGRRLALGVVPSYLYNAILESSDTEQALTIGLQGQFYVNKLMSLLAEWNITDSGYYYKHDAASIGIELETGGHFFKIVATNSTRLNPSQFLMGTNANFAPDNWHLGFNITRLLKF